MVKVKHNKKNKNLSHKKNKKSGINVRLLRGGGCSAPDVVSHYISPPHSNIPVGYQGMDNIFQRVFYTPGAAETNLITQNGGGYFNDFTDTIGKVPAVQGYNDQAPPVILNGEVYLSNGCQSQCGAGKISSYNLYNVKKMTQVKSNKLKPKVKKSTHRKSKSHSRSHSSSKKSSRKSIVKKKKGKSHQKKHKFLQQMGGEEGVPGNFSNDMSTRDFSGKQPEWNVNTI
jgi:hypothetical protein